MQLTAIKRYGLSQIEPRAVLIGLGLRPQPINSVLGSHGYSSGLKPS